MTKLLASIYKEHKTLLMADVKSVSKNKDYQRGYRHGANQMRRDMIATIGEYIEKYHIRSGG